MSFTERNPVIIGIIATMLIAVVTVAALTVKGSMLRGGYELITEFEDAAGLRPGDDIFIAGIRAGTVESIDIVSDRVEIRVSVNGHDLPSETRAQIVVRTLTGNRGLELVADGDYDDLLEEGDVIPRDRTDEPIDAPEFGDVSEELLSETDSAALNDLLVSLTDVTRGQREEIARLIEGGNRVTEVVNEQEEDIRSLLNSLAEVAIVLNASGDDIVMVIDEFSSTLQTLRARRTELQRFFRQTNTTAATAADLVGRERAELDRILTDVHDVTDALSRHQMDVAEALAYAGDSIVGFSSIGYSHEAKVPWGHVFANSAGPLGIDIIAACGGLIDQQLDEVFGPDPRSCEEQENDTFPENPNEQKGEEGEDGDDPQAESSGGQSRAGSSTPQGLDSLALRALGSRPPREAQR